MQSTKVHIYYRYNGVIVEELESFNLMSLVRVPSSGLSFIVDKADLESVRLAPMSHIDMSWTPKTVFDGFQVFKAN